MYLCEMGVKEHIGITPEEKELMLQSMIESFKLENIHISEERARAILQKIDLNRGK